MTATTTTEIAAGRRIALADEVVGLERSGKAVLVPPQAGPPQRIDGFTVGAPMLTGDAPHGGEMHPDGDELLDLVSGAVQVRLELETGLEAIELRAGEAIVIPRGTWHRIVLQEPGQLIHITPGPRGEHRPKSEAR
jgi:mannose-6-phosphate isomerase-like protein (cupin superfamily)